VSADAWLAAHDRLTAISEGIDAVSAAYPDSAFRYRGADLRAAVERATFVSLSNDAALAAAYAADGTVAAATPFDAHVAARVVGQIAVDGPGRIHRARLQLSARRRRPNPPVRAATMADWPTGGVWFLLDHAKFLALVEPVASELDDGPARVLWAGSRLRPADRMGQPALDELTDVAPTRARDGGAALEGFAGLLGEYDRVAAALRRLRPDCLVVIEGNSPYDGLASAAARVAGVPVACLQNGWSPIVHSGFRRLPFDRMCVWGDGFAQLLMPYNPGLDLVATGHPTLGHASVPTAASVGASVAFFLQPTSPYNAPQHLDAMLALIDRVAEQAPEATILVREHPGHPAPRDKWPANVVLANAPQPLAEVIGAARVVTSIYSTSLIEGAALGRPALSFNPTSLPRLLPDLEAEGAGLESDDADRIHRELLALLADKESLSRYAAGTRRIRDHYFAGLPADAAAHTAKAITAL